MIDREPLKGDPNCAHKPGDRFCRRYARPSMPNLDAQGLASPAGEAKTRASALGIWEMSVKNWAEWTSEHGQNRAIRRLRRENDSSGGAIWV